jgi:hypothetical protein
MRPRLRRWIDIDLAREFVGQRHRPRGQLGQDWGAGALTQPVQRLARCGRGGDRGVDGDEGAWHDAVGAGHCFSDTAGQRATVAAARLVELVLAAAHGAGVHRGEPRAVTTTGRIRARRRHQSAFGSTSSARAPPAQGSVVARITHRAFGPAHGRWTVLAAVSTHSAGSGDASETCRDAGRDPPAGPGPAAVTTHADGQLVAVDADIGIGRCGLHADRSDPVTAATPPAGPQLGPVVARAAQRLARLGGDDRPDTTATITSRCLAGHLAVNLAVTRSHLVVALDASPTRPQVAHSRRGRRIRGHRLGLAACLDGDLDKIGRCHRQDVTQRGQRCQVEPLGCADHQPIDVLPWIVLSVAACVSGSSQSNASNADSTTPPSTTSAPPTVTTALEVPTTEAASPTTQPTATSSTPPGWGSTALDVNAQTVFGVGVGYVSSDQVLVDVSAEMGPASSDTGWYTLPSLAPDDTTTDCLANIPSRILHWGDLSIAFFESKFGVGGQFLRSWSVGAAISSQTDRREPNMPLSPEPTGLQTAESIAVGSALDDVTTAYGQRFLFVSQFDNPDISGNQIEIDQATGSAIFLRATNGIIDGIGASISFC